MKIPEKFLNRMKNILPDFDEFLNSYEHEPIKSFFINTSKISEQDFMSCNEWEIEKKANGYILKEDIKVGKTPEHHAGLIYMQELSAMMPASFLPLKPTDWVLDLCAAPGGKSIQAALKVPEGLLVCNEIIKSRANILKSNIERMGLSNACVINNEPSQLENMFGGVFDAVIVDAPCSGEGMFRKDEQARLNWSEENVKACAIRQKAILKTADKMLKQNGYLVYSTCTFSLEENEQVVADFCNEFGYKIVPLKFNGATNGFDVGGAKTKGCLRFYPHKFWGEGQFVALLQKSGEAERFINEKIHFKPLSKFPTEFRLVKEFLSNFEDLENFEANLVFKNNVVYFLANRQIAESGVNLINAGVVVGEIVKLRFEPNHNFITCFGSLCKRKLNLTLQEANLFLKGEVLNSSMDNGYVVLTFKGTSLGVGKVVGGMIKNHYPKGLRNL